MADETITDDRTTKDRATDVAATAKDEARGIAGDARSEASAVVSEAGTRARYLADEARTALRRQVADGTGRAAGAIDQLAGHLRALAGGDPEQAGDLRRYAGDLGDRLGGVAGHINERGIGGLVEDVQRFARRRPGVFLAVAAGAGFAAGRLFRGAAAHSDDDAGSSGNGSTAYRPGAGATPEPGGAGGSTAALVTEGAEPGGPASGTTLGSVPQGGATGDDTPSGAR